MKRRTALLLLLTAGAIAASAADWSGYRWAVIGDSLSDPRLNPVGGKYHDLYAARPDDPLDFRRIDPRTPGGSVDFAKKYTRDYREKGAYGHPSAAYNREFLAPRFTEILGRHLGSSGPTSK